MSIFDDSSWWDPSAFNLGFSTPAAPDPSSLSWFDPSQFNLGFTAPSPTFSPSSFSLGNFSPSLSVGPYGGGFTMPGYSFSQLYSQPSMAPVSGGGGVGNWNAGSIMNLIGAGLPALGGLASLLASKGGGGYQAPQPSATAQGDPYAAMMQAYSDMMLEYQGMLAEMMGGLGGDGGGAPAPSSGLPASQVEAAVRQYLAHQQALGMSQTPDANAIANALGIPLNEIQAALTAIQGGGAPGTVTGMTTNQLTGDFGGGSDMSKIMAYLQNQGIDQSLAQNIWTTVGANPTQLYNLIQQAGSDPAKIKAWLDQYVAGGNTSSSWPEA